MTKNVTTEVFFAAIVVLKFAVEQFDVVIGLLQEVMWKKIKVVLQTQYVK